MSWVPENLSYKLVALGVAILLWLSMLGRKETSMLKDLEVQVQTAPGLEMSGAPLPLIRAEISGPRVAIKKINQMNPIYTVDLTNAAEGRHLVQLSRQGVNLPVGARVLSLEPSDITVQIIKIPAPKEIK